MIALRIPIAVLLGGAFSVVLFWLLYNAVSGPLPEAQTAQAHRIEFTRMRKDTDVETKRQDKPDREPPPPTPEVPRMQMASSSIDNNLARINPVVDASGALQRLKLTAGSDTDVIPLVRIPPEYPARALSRELEGWVLVRFTITPTGTVKDAVVVSAEPKGIFDDAALKAIARWRYNPKIENGQAVERVGVQTRLEFQLDDSGR